MDLYLSTVSDLLWESLKEIMQQKEFDRFRLVGGTSLSLQLGHRESVDIDMFTDAEYGSLDFERLEALLKEKFQYVDSLQSGLISFGKSFFIGKSKEKLVKLDLFYTDGFVFPPIDVEGVRLASIKEVAAMKLDIIGRGGRKKDFWDVHELLDSFTMEEMIKFYLKRYPYNFNRDEIIDGLTNFEAAEHEFIPICYRDKIWDLIKLDFEYLAETLRTKG